MIEGPFLFVVHPIEGERSGRNYGEKEREGEERKEGSLGRSSFAGQARESLPRETKGGGREMSSLLLLQNKHHSHAS